MMIVCVNYTWSHMIPELSQYFDREDAIPVTTSEGKDGHKNYGKH